MADESWLGDLASGVGWTSVGGVIAWLTNLWLQRRKRSAEVAEKKQARADRLSVHDSGMTLELLKLAHSEIGMLKEQMAQLTAMVGRVPALERRVEYLDEALFHIKQLIDPDGGTGRAEAEDAARLFFAKMIALREVKGIAANREQAARAAKSLDEREKGDDL